MLKNLIVEQYTTPSPVITTPQETVVDVANLMAEKGIRHIPVIEGDQIVGMVSERDLKILTALEPGRGLSVREVMTADPYCVESSTPLEQVAFHMSANKIGSAIVLDAQRQVQGIFTSTDALNALIEILRGDVEEE